MVPIKKEILATLASSLIMELDENTPTYGRTAEILLITFGVVDAEGNLTEAYANSPMWEGGNDGTPLRPSVKAEIAAKIPKRLWKLLESVPEK